MHLDEEEFSNLTKLCRIECSLEEKEVLFRNISKILSHMTQLNEINTQDILPCNQVTETVIDTMREDEIGPLLSRKEFLDNAPSHTGGMIRVPNILKTAT